MLVHTYYGVASSQFLTPKESFYTCENWEVSLDLRRGCLLSLFQQNKLTLSLEL